MPLNIQNLARWWLASLVLFSLNGWADGILTHMSGQVSVRKADGSTPIGRVGLKISNGDSVLTGANGYVRMEMTDGGEIVLRPNSEMRIENYRYSADKPSEDKFSFNMVKGGLRTVTGLIGKRGNKDAYEMKSVTATIGIRGTQFDARICDGNCGALANGTYAAVRVGAIQVTNAQGSVPVAAGQVVHAPVQQAPMILPRDPGIGFTPPATIPKLDEKKKTQSNQSSTTTQQSPQTSSSGRTTSGSQQQRSTTAQSSSQDGKSQSGNSGSGTSGGSTQASGGTTSSGGDAGRTTGATSETGSGGSTGAAAGTTASTIGGATGTSSPAAAQGTAPAATSVGTDAATPPAVSTHQPTSAPSSAAQLMAPAQNSTPQGVECVVQ